MREMKDSGIEWIGEIPVDWELLKGKWLFAQRNERGNNLELQLLSPTQKYGVIPQEMYEKLSGLKAVKLKENADLSSFKTIHSGDFCISLRSFQGGFEYSEYEGVVSPAYQVFYGKCNVCNGYFKYLFKNAAFIDKMNSYAMSLRDGKMIAFDDFSNSLIPVPSFFQQQRIAEYLDDKCTKIDAIIEKQQAIIEKLKAYKLSVITEAVTKGLNPDVTMKDSGIEWIGEIPYDSSVVPLTKQLKSIVDYRGKTPEKVDEGVFLVTAKNIKNGTIDYSLSQEFVKKDEYEEIMHRGKPEVGDVLFTTEAPLGQVANVDRRDIALAQRVIKFQTKESLNPYFLKYWIMSNGFQEYLQTLATGSTAKGIKASKLFMLTVVLYPLVQQEHIVEYLNKKCFEIENMINRKQIMIDKLVVYKKSLIYEVVTGKKEV